MFPEEGENKPKIRFTGFTDAWEQRQFNEIADRFDNLRIPVEEGKRIPGNTPYFGANGIQDYVSGFTHDGEYILVAEDGASDLVNYPVQYVFGKIWVNNHSHVLRGKTNLVNTKFLKFAFCHSDIRPLLVGGSRAKLNAEALMNFRIFLPMSYAEQTMIGDFFSGLEDCIVLHQRE